ncbi:MAG TPA: alkaline phosphatase family protein [Candidatus Limnocylindrales bacterium]|nr:alkaline phosphatase family protein [Candidatus Limnocylindrales bacterium]
MQRAIRRPGARRVPPRALALGAAAIAILALLAAGEVGATLLIAGVEPNEPAGAAASPAPPGSAGVIAIAPSPTGVIVGSLPAPDSATVPRVAHVFVIVMENKEYGSIVGSSAAPYINSLIARYGLATNYDAVAHPSEPNYFALWAGTTRGVTTDGTYNFTSGATLASQLESKGLSWHVAAENVPLGCYKGSTASGGEDGPGTYARKHEPAISWTAVSGSSTRCSRITDFSHFNPNSGSFWLIVPNLCNDMHDCSVAHGDAFLKGFLPKILTSAAFTNGVVLLTWDEGTTSTGGGGHVATLVISPLAKTGYRSATSHNHYSLLHTAEELLGLGCIADACSANDLRELFR